MKKSLLALLCVVILGAALVLGACGNKGGSGSQGGSSSVVADDVQSILEAYLNSEVNQEGIQSLNESMESLGISLEVYADGSSIVYNYTYADIPSTTEGLAEQLAASMESQADALKTAAEQVEEDVDVDGVSMVYNYIGSDGILIYSETYTKDGLVK